MKNYTISSNALEILKSYLSKDREIVDLQVKGKWLCALLDTGLYFSVLNK
jgi:hypothetical protein